jgi:RNA polymerase sigma-70 factor (ECF subfamily)
MKFSVNYSKYDDEKLIRLIVQQQEGALAQLYDRYSRLIFSLAFAMINDRATAEEITLDVFLRVWQKAGTYRPDQSKLTTWLTRIARNHAIDVLRRRAARSDQYAVQWEEIHSEIPQQHPEESAELSMRRERIQNALAQLPSDQKQVVMLAYFGGYTQNQIAKMLKQPLGTVKTRVRLGLQKLRDILHDEQMSANKSSGAQPAYNIFKEEQ